MTPPPGWQDAARVTATTVLAPFISPVMPDGPDGDVAARDHVRNAARSGDTRPLPVVLGACAFTAARGLRDHGDGAVVPELVEGDDPDSEWVPRLLRGGGGDIEEAG